MPDGRTCSDRTVVLGVLFVDAFLGRVFFSGFRTITRPPLRSSLPVRRSHADWAEGLFAFLLVSSHEWEAAHAESDYARAVRAVVRHGTRAVEATSAAPDASERDRAAAAIRGLEAQLSAGRPLYGSWEVDAYLQGAMTTVGDAEFGEPHQARLTVALQSCNAGGRPPDSLISYLETH